MDDQVGSRFESQPHVSLSAGDPQSIGGGKEAVHLGLELIFVKLNGSFGKAAPAGVVESLLKWVRPTRGQMAVLIAATVVRRLLDTTVQDMLETNGRLHFRSAMNTLAEVDNETSTRRQREKLATAQGALRDAYEFFVDEVTRAEARAVPKRSAIVNAHRYATEAAMYVARIDWALHSGPTNVAEWAKRATEHFERYSANALVVANHGLFRSAAATFGGLGCMAAASALSGGVGILLGVAGASPMLGAGGFVTILAGSSQFRRYRGMPTALKRERAQLHEFCANLNG